MPPATRIITKNVCGVGKVTIKETRDQDGEWRQSNERMVTKKLCSGGTVTTKEIRDGNSWEKA